MVLAVNIGNTHICIGGYENGAQAFSAKLSSEPPRTADEYALQLCSLLAMRGLGGAVIEGGSWARSCLPLPAKCWPPCAG